MFKKTITYTDYNDVERTETFYFNLNEAEILEMEASENGGYAEMLKSVVDSKDSKQIMQLFKTLLLKSYGIKTPDGKGFMKSKEIVDEFEHSAAYSKIFMDLCTNAEEASRFVQFVLPLKPEQREAIKDSAKTTSLPSELK